jgi:hypothetical protein
MFDPTPRSLTLLKIFFFSFFLKKKRKKKKEKERKKGNCYMFEESQVKYLQSTNHIN